jgi:hypothetical protein
MALAHRGAVVSMPAGDGQVLSVAELQAALALAHARSAQRHGVATVAARPSERPLPVAAEPNTVLPLEQVSVLGERCIVVVSAHAGAGASTVALGLADAAAADGTPVRLVDCAVAAESGLADAASEVVGIDRTGRWYRGRRGTVTIHHVADATLLGEAGCGLTVIDSGPVRRGESGGLGGAIGVVLVCAATVPGLRQAEAALAGHTGPVVLAAVGPRKWPGVVTASLGPTAAGLRGDGRLVRVPLDRRLAATGLTGDPLPRRVVAAARAVLQLLPAPATTVPPAQHADGTAATR